MAYGGGGNKNLDDYVPVHVRIEQFRAQHPKGRILTTILDGETLTVRAEVYFEGNETAIPNATAHASEDGGMAGRKSSAVEKTETAAVGRALAFCGYEVKEGIASREEAQRPPSRPAPAQKPATKDAQHAKVEADIREAQRILKRSEPNLQQWVEKKYETDSKWHELSLDTKEEILAFLNSQINKGSAKA